MSLLKGISKTDRQAGSKTRPAILYADMVSNFSKQKNIKFLENILKIILIQNSVNILSAL